MKCRSCQHDKSEDAFPARTDKGVVRKRRCCLQCESSARLTRKQTPRKRSAEEKARHAANARDRRADPNNRARYIVWDSRRFDKKRGLENDLTEEFVKEKISGGCAFCGETELHMTMDRIDNTLGHVQSNVIPACERCNLMRRDMPFEAWSVLAKAVKQIRQDGLFGSWTGSIHRKEPRVSGDTTGLLTSPQS